MAKLYDTQSGNQIGTITAADLKFLIDQLEEEDTEDQDYYIDRATLDWFEEHDANPTLVTLLREALGSNEGMEIRWTED